jgi:hypothetical protein
MLGVMGILGRLFSRTTTATPEPAPIQEPGRPLPGGNLFPESPVSGTTTFTREGALAIFPPGQTGMRDIEAITRVEPDNPVQANALALIVDGSTVGYLARSGGWPAETASVRVPVRAWCAIEDGEQRVEAHAWIGAGEPRWTYGPSNPYAVTRAEKPVQRAQERAQVRERNLAAGGHEGRYARALLVNGKMPFEWIDTIAEMKREKNYDEALTLALACVEAEEAGHRVNAKLPPAPAYYEQAAIIFRKQKRYADEVEIIERYLELAKKRAHQKMKDRLPKAKALLEKQRQAHQDA